MNMSKEVVCRLEFEGIHHWPNCNIAEVAYLKTLHRHIFKIKCFKKVSHDDRDIEFIKLGHKIKSFVEKKYYNKQFKCCFFESMSCESIAVELIENFGLSRCEVFEDGENGSIITVL